MLEFALQVIGAGKITTKRTVSAKHTPSFTYAVYNRQALSLLQQVQPFLRTYKAERASLILSKYLEPRPRNEKYSTELKQAREQFENAVLQVKASVN